MNHQDLRGKYDKVTAWLESISNDEVIPNYEVTEETIQYLERVRDQHQKKDRIAKLYLSDVQTKCDEYQTGTKALKELLDMLGLPVYTLSNAGKSSLRMLSQLANILKVKDVNKSTYFIALNDFQKHQKEVLELLDLQKKDIDFELKQIEESVKSLEAVSLHSRKVAEYAVVDAPFRDRKKKDIINFKSKCDAYKKQLSEDIFKGDVSTVDKQYSHGLILKLNEELNILKEELKPLESQYQTYCSLPPDIQLAKVKIEETKRYLQKLENELEADIDYFSL